MCEDMSGVEPWRLMRIDKCRGCEAMFLEGARPEVDTPTYRRCESCGSMEASLPYIAPFMPKFRGGEWPCMTQV